MINAAPESNGVVAQNEEFLVDAPEILVFSKCLGLVRKVVTLVGAFEAGRTNRAVSVEELNPVLSKLIRMAEATSRFDIVLPVTSYGHFSPFFWRWFNWWNDYRKTMTPEQIRQIERLGRKANIAVVGHRPAGDWLTYRETPAFELEISE